MSWRTRDLVAVAAVLGALLTLAVALDPSVRLSIEAAELRTAMETAQALVAATGAYLVYGRVKRSRSLNDLAIVFGLGLLAVSNLFFAAIPSKLDSALVFQVWAPLVNRLLAGLAFAAAALLPDHRLPRWLQRPGVAVVVATDLVLTAIALVVAALVNVLPAGVSVVGHNAGTPELHGHPLLIAGLVAKAAISLAAAFGFARRADGRNDPLMSALAVGMVLTAFSYVCFAIYPSIDTEIVQGGDALRLGFYLVLLFGAEREIDRYWTRLADVAIYDERRRLARDLHDGVAQELAYVVTQARLLERGTAPPGTNERVSAAAERALDESRRAIIALTLHDDEPLHLALARAAEDVAGRVGVEVRVDVSPDLEVPPQVREGLVRIVQEAVSNAGRHGQARFVDVTLGPDRVLRIQDDGGGFDVAATPDGRFGLVAMRERAERLGGTFAIDSHPGAGTKVEVVL
ncbi:MAG: sensor histidine kinase [Acidobacteria bacterium]|nr:sensor histidine kinase [Acidobacteriota bacterium]